MEKDYKETLILPKTDFPMKGNLPQKEPIRYQKWQEYAYDKMSMQKDSTQESFNLHDGPPYANGHLHVGHALNKILKDFIVKYQYFNGKQVFYTPGWDCHGLPIEQQVSSACEAEKKIPSKLEVRKMCREHANKFVSIQKEEFRSLGVIGDFDNPYQTMKYRFEADIYRALVQVAKQGLLTQRSKPIFWSWAAKSALAEAEVEYKDKKSDSIFVAFPLSKEALCTLQIESVQTKKDPFMLIWTTTPWTLPSNVAIALKPGEIYVLTSDGAIIAKKRYEGMLQKGIISGEIIKEIESEKFERLIAKNPLNGRDSLLLLADYVSMDDGTGAVHNAPGHGEDDYFTCLRYDLPVIMPVSDDGCFDASIQKLGLFPENVVSEFIGMHIFKAQKRILELLKEAQLLLFHEEITHSYPHCWRTNKPIIFRATKQWFIVMDKPYYNGKTLREVALEEIEKTKFYPSNGANRIKSMVENRPDWCISRQRDWGVPIAFFIHKESKEILFDSVVMDHIADLFEQHGCDIWWEKDSKELLPAQYQDKADQYEKNMHILDVWFDSGSTWLAVLESGEYKAGNYPADIYLEGSDQHRGWFQSSLLISCAIHYKAPFKTIITHGFTIDDKSEKMSKSKGNVLAPNKIISENGSEILRLWVALSDYQNDVKISQNILKQVSENYLKLRNTIRFLLANTQGLQELCFENLSPIDVWVLNEAKRVFAQIDSSFSEYDFSKGFQILNGFITMTLSGIYLDICKDSLYCDAKTSKKRLAIQSVFGLLANRVLHLLAPFLTYTVDEALEYAEDVIKGNALNVFELQCIDFPVLDGYANFNQADFTFLLTLRSLFNENVDKLKKEKIIKSSLELELCIPKEYEAKKDLIADFLMVSGCSSDIQSQQQLFTIEIDSKKFSAFVSSKNKCPRCWQFKSELAQDVCKRCDDVLHVK